MTSFDDEHDPACPVDHEKVNELCGRLADLAEEFHAAFGEGYTTTGFVLCISGQKLEENGGLMEGFDYITARNSSIFSDSGLIRQCLKKMDRDLGGF